MVSTNFLHWFLFFIDGVIILPFPFVFDFFFLVSYQSESQLFTSIPCSKFFNSLHCKSERTATNTFCFHSSFTVLSTQHGILNTYSIQISDLTLFVEILQLIQKIFKTLSSPWFPVFQSIAAFWKMFLLSFLIFMIYQLLTFHTSKFLHFTCIQLDSYSFKTINKPGFPLS